MAGEDTQKKIDLMYDSLIKSQKEQERATDRLSSAMLDLGDKTIEILTNNLKAAAKQAKILSDEQVDLIKNSDDLVAALKQQEAEFENLTEASHKKYKADLEAVKSVAGFEKFSKSTQDRLLKDSFDRHNAELQQIQDLQASHHAFNEHIDKSIEGAKSLNNFTSWLGKGSKGMKGWLAKTFTFEKALGDLKDATYQAISELNKATAVGLQSSFSTINLGAKDLKMSFDEFSEVIANNRDVVRQLGGGYEGVKNFAKVLKDTSGDLSYMGRAGIFATDKFIGTLKNIGTTVNSKEFNKSVKSMQRHFSDFSVMYGDSADSFDDLIGTQMKSEGIQARLNGLDDIGRQKLLEEIVARTDNIKTLGLSNEQIKVFNSKIDDLYDPKKTNIAEKYTSSQYMKSYAQTLSEETGNKDLKASLSEINDLMDSLVGATRDQAKTELAKHSKALRAIGDAEKDLQAQKAELNANPLTRAQAVTHGMTSRQFLQEAGGLGQDIYEQGGALSTANLQHLAQTPEQKAKELQQAADDRNQVDVDLYTKAIEKARYAQENYNALMENSVTKMSNGVAEGFLAVIMSIGKFKGALELLTKGMKMGVGGEGVATLGGEGVAMLGGGGLIAGAGVVAGEGYLGYKAITSYIDLLDELDHDDKENEVRKAKIEKKISLLRSYGGEQLAAQGSKMDNQQLDTMINQLRGNPRFNQLNPSPVTATSEALTPTPTSSTVKAVPVTATSEALVTTSTSSTVEAVNVANPMLDETKKQTSLLQQIANNTLIAFKPKVSDHMYKKAPEIVRNNIR